MNQVDFIQAPNPELHTSLQPTLLTQTDKGQTGIYFHYIKPSKVSISNIFLRKRGNYRIIELSVDVNYQMKSYSN